MRDGAPSATHVVLHDSTGTAPGRHMPQSQVGQGVEEYILAIERGEPLPPTPKDEVGCRAVGRGQRCVMEIVLAAGSHPSTRLAGHGNGRGLFGRQMWHRTLLLVQHPSGLIGQSL